MFDDRDKDTGPNMNDVLTQQGEPQGESSELFSGLVSNPMQTPSPQTPPQNPYGDLEITKHLYKTGLQNIFNDYQKNVANLDSAKQQSLQDAYTIKRLSKKYLGEYASNVGVGDVSDHLLDIYGNYQQNLQSIQQNFGELQMGLEKEFQQERERMTAELMLTKHNIEVAKMGEVANQILFNAIHGNTEGMSPFEYLEKHRADMGEQNYQAAHDVLYQQVFEEVATNIQQGFFGYEEDESGEMVRRTNPEEYLRQFKGVLTESHYNMFQGALPSRMGMDVAFNIAKGDYQGFESGFEYLESIRSNLSQEEYISYYSAIRENVVRELQVRAEEQFFGYRDGEDGEREMVSAQEYLDQIDRLYGDVLGSDFEFSYYRERIELNKNIIEEQTTPIEVRNISSRQIFDPEQGSTVDNPHYAEDLDLYGYSLFSGDDFGTDSQVYSIEGQRYVQINSSLDHDEVGRERRGDDFSSISSLDVTDEFNQEYGRPPHNGDVFFHSSGVVLRREGGNWHRMETLSDNTMKPSHTEMALWDTDNDDQGLMSIDTKWPAKDVISIGGREYKVDGSDVGWDGVPDEVKRLFEQVHGADPTEGLDKDGFGDRNRARVVYYNGQFWYAKTRRGWSKGVRYMPMKRND